MKHLLVFISLSLSTCTSLDPEGKNVCKEKVTTENIDNGTKIVREHFKIECCPDYSEKNGECQECSPGTFGKNCMENCSSGRFGQLCAYTCSCDPSQHCDKKRGCVCDDGFTGHDCSSVCPAGFFGENCQQECICANDAECNPTSGQCICPAGWIGRYCTDKCDDGRHGFYCSLACDCQTGVNCDHVTGRCSDGDSYKETPKAIEGQSSLTVYLMMASAVTGLVVFVVMVIKVKEAITTKVTKQVPVVDILTDNGTTNQKHVATTSLDDAAETRFATEDIYCEIDEF